MGIATIVVIAMTAAVHLLLVVTVDVRVLPRVVVVHLLLAVVHLLLVVSVAVRRPPLLLLLLQSLARALAAMTAVAPQQSQNLARALAAVDAVAPHHLTKEVVGKALPKEGGTIDSQHRPRLFHVCKILY